MNSLRKALLVHIITMAVTIAADHYVWGQVYEVPAQLDGNDMALGELLVLANDTVLRNVDVQTEDLECAANHTIFSNITGTKQVRFMFSITNAPGPIVTLNSVNGDLLAYANPIPSEGSAQVSSNDAISIAEAFLATNGIEPIAGIASQASFQDLGSGGQCWLVYRFRVSSDGTPSDSAASVFVDAVTANALSYQSGYELEADYGAVDVTEQQARSIVRDAYGASKFDQASVTALLRIANCTAWALENQGGTSVRVWHVTVTSPPEAEDGTLSDYFVKATTGEEHLPL